MSDRPVTRITIQACMSPAPSGSLALQHVKLSDALKIWDGIIFEFYPALPHVYLKDSWLPLSDDDEGFHLVYYSTVNAIWHIFGTSLRELCAIKCCLVMKLYCDRLCCLSSGMVHRKRYQIILYLASVYFIEPLRWSLLLALQVIYVAFIECSRSPIIKSVCCNVILFSQWWLLQNHPLSPLLFLLLAPVVVGPCENFRQAFCILCRFRKHNLGQLGQSGHYCTILSLLCPNSQS